MLDSICVNSIGLVLDIIGAILLFFFGLPPKIDPEGKIRLIASQRDEDEIRRGKIYKIMSPTGIILIIIGFILQLVSNYIN